MKRRTVMVSEPRGPDAVVVEESEVPRPGDHDVVIQVEAASLNFPDLLMTSGEYQLRPDVPFALGSEAVGRLCAVGNGVADFKVGDQVWALTWYGAFTTHLTLDARQLQPNPEAMKSAERNPNTATLRRTAIRKLPDEIRPAQAAAMGFAYSSSLHALRDRAGLQEGESLLVLGAAGGLGLAAVEIGRVLGATVIAAASTDEKLEVCKDHGATHVFNYEKEDLKDLRSAFGRVDVVFDPVGGDYSESALRALRPEGRHLIVGFTAGVPSIRMNLPLLKECQIVGAAWGAWSARYPELQKSNLELLVKWYMERRLNPRTRYYRLDQIKDALRDMQQRRVLGKIVLLVKGEPPTRKGTDVSR